MGLFNKRKQRLEAERIAREKAELAEKMRQQAKEQAERLLKIINDCVNLVNTTKEPGVFFPRYCLMLEHLESLAGLECTGIFDNSPELPSAVFLRIEEQFPDATTDFINRSFEAAKEKAAAYKTEKGRSNYYRRYFESFDKYISYMDTDNQKYFESLKEEHLT